MIGEIVKNLIEIFLTYFRTGEVAHLKAKSSLGHLEIPLFAKVHDVFGLTTSTTAENAGMLTQG